MIIKNTLKKVNISWLSAIFVAYMICMHLGISSTKLSGKYRNVIFYTNREKVELNKEMQSELFDGNCNGPCSYLFFFLPCNLFLVSFLLNYQV